jgi:hypothetical protein
MEVEKKLFFHLSVLTKLNSYIILSPCDRRVYYRKFCLILVQNLLKMRTWEPHPQYTIRGRPNPQTSKMKCLEAMHQPVARSCLCCVCVAKNKWTATKFQCISCKVGLCTGPCFRIYHTKVNF